ncbi:hypothetical protein GCM10023261_13860 [Bartonella jaculi]|uniref:Uncharacterized protein n=1 Tax=Bartonella jaculi TaxID=686226 RepID=A0ABP9N5R3_9HYPH
MSKHFLLIAHARNILPLAIARLSDDKCHAMLCELRWVVQKSWFARNAKYNIKPITLSVINNGNVSIANIALV